MDLGQIEKEYKDLENLHFRVSIFDTINNLNIGESTYILFKDGKPNSIRTTANRITGKSFLITEKGFIDRTYVKRKR